MKNYINVILLVFAVSLLFCCGCGAEKKKSENMEESNRITGDISILNKSSNDIFVTTVMGGREEDFGGVAIGAEKTIGFAQIIIGKETSVVWSERDYDAPKKIAYFDNSKIADLKDKIKGFQFVYLGNDKWKLQVFKAPHRYKKDLLREVESSPTPYLKKSKEK